ncbi:relaxase/mobilization nuclease domain-containing protein [Nocardioides maradonensis]
MREATHLGRVVEASWRRQYAPELALAGLGAGGISREGLHSAISERLAAERADGAVRHDLAAQQDHVFHATISLHPSEGPFTDEQWNEVATKYMEAMGFTGQEGRPDASWYAVHHGLSKDGNDHIHIVASTTLRDGRRIDLHNSGRRSQDVRREVLEKLDFVQPLHEASRAHRTPRTSSFTAAEHNIARDRAARGEGPATPDRVLLQRLLRAAAADATTEAAFINNVIKHRRQPDGAGLEIVAARWKPGSNKQDVTGYKIRFKNGTWFSASTLSPDLTLGKLRASWTGETDASRSYARALWAEQARGEKRAATPDAPEQLDQAAAHLASVNETLQALDPTDVDAWNHVEAAAAGATAVLSTAAPSGVDEDGRETGFNVDAGRASDVLTRQWLEDNYNRQATGAPQVPAGLSGMEIATRHLQLAIRATGTDRHNGWLAVIRQLGRTMTAIADAKEARGELIAAETLRRDGMAAMARLETWLGATVTPPTAAAPEPAADLSAAAKAAREASAHATEGRTATTPATTQPGQPARVDRGPEPRRDRGPRRG